MSLCKIKNCCLFSYIKNDNICMFHFYMRDKPKCNVEKCENHVYQNKVCGVHYSYYTSNTPTGSSTDAAWCKECGLEYPGYCPHKCPNK